MSVILMQVGILLFFCLIGYILGKGGIIGTDQTKAISSLIIYVFCPALTLSSFAENCTVNYLSKKYVLVFICIAVSVVLFFFGKLFSRLLTKDNYTVNVFTYSFVCPNFGYMGYALAEGVYGSEALLDVIVFTLPLTVFIYAVGFPMLTGKRQSVIKSVLCNPSIIAIILGAIIGLCGITLPTVVNNILSMAGSCMAPLAMLLTGLVISEFKFFSLFNDFKIYIVMLVRLVAIPLALFFVLKPFLSKELLLPVVLVAALPCGLNTVVFPKLVGKDCKTGAALAVISGLLCVATIPLVLSLF